MIEFDFINNLEWTNDSSNDGCITQQLRTCQTNTGDAGCCGDDYVKGKNRLGFVTKIQESRVVRLIILLFRFQKYLYRWTDLE